MFQAAHRRHRRKVTVQLPITHLSWGQAQRIERLASRRKSHHDLHYHKCNIANFLKPSNTLKQFSCHQVMEAQEEVSVIRTLASPHR